jgi:hypothetical protein
MLWVKNIADWFMALWFVAIASFIHDLIMLNHQKITYTVERDGANMDNFGRGLHSYLGAGTKTSLGVCLTELKH